MNASCYWLSGHCKLVNDALVFSARSSVLMPPADAWKRGATVDAIIAAWTTICDRIWENRP